MAVKPMEAARKVAEESGWNLSNLRIQKILYLAHMLYLWRHDKPLIEGDSFEAWDYGPVLPSLYNKLKIFGSKPVGNIFRNYKEVSDNTKEGAILKEAVESLGRLPASKLVAVTHQDQSAWREYYTPGARGVDIPNERIYEEAKHRLKGEEG